MARDETTIIEACLRAAVEGPFIPQRIFHTLFGLHHHEVATVLAEWPDVQNTDTAYLAINNSINNLLGYPHGASEEEWDTYIPISRARLMEFFSVWRGKTRPGSGVGYLEAME